MAGRRGRRSTTGRSSANAGPKTSGLHEVYARFDDEQEYVGKAIDDPLYAQRQDRHAGRRPSRDPVGAVRRDGVLRGIRFVSDPRGGAARAPHGAYAAARRHQPLRAGRLELHGFAAGAGRNARVGGVFIKQRCEKDDARASPLVEARFLRKPGQNDVDPATGEYRQASSRAGPASRSSIPATRNRSLSGPPETSLIRHRR